jgi:hypothetical protein
LTRLAVAAFALVLWAIPFAVAPIKPVAAIGAVGLALAAVGIGGLWRGPVTAAACVFLIEYAAALAVARSPVSVGGAIAFGLAVLFLLESVELGRALRGARIEGRAIGSLVGARLALAATALGVTLLGLALAGGFVASIPFAAAPFVAGLAAFGIVLALATLVKR